MAADQTTRTHQLLQVCQTILTTWADPAVDIAAIVGLAYLATSVDPSIATELGGFIVAVAGGKKYFDAKRRKQ